jgi:hypothetical protein
VDRGVVHADLLGNLLLREAKLQPALPEVVT